MSTLGFRLPGRAHFSSPAPRIQIVCEMRFTPVTQDRAWAYHINPCSSIDKGPKPIDHTPLQGLPLPAPSLMILPLPRGGGRHTHTQFVT